MPTLTLSNARLSDRGYASLASVQAAIRELRRFAEPDYALTPVVIEGYWRIRYTPRPSLAENAPDSDLLSC